MLSVEKVNAGYGHLRVLQDVDLDVRQGELVCVIGPNGAGKTTLLRAICGMLAVGSGAIGFDGATIRGLGPAAVVARGIAMVPEGRRVFAPLTVRENLLMGAYLRRGQAQRAAVRRDLEGMYETFPILEKREDQMAGLLSGGEQQMLALARALMSRPRLLLLDEPSQGLAPKAIDQVARAVNRIAAQDVAILLVEQNLRLAEMVAHHTVVLETGSCVAEGMASDILASSAIQDSYLGRKGVDR